MVEIYHEFARKSKTSSEFVKYVKTWWKSRFKSSPPDSQKLHLWYKNRGY